MLKKEGEVEFKCKPHQLYNTLFQGIKNNRSLADTARFMRDEKLAIQLDHQADYQEYLLNSLFKDGKVKYEQ